MKRRSWILAGIIGLIVAGPRLLWARPGETLDQLTERLGPPSQTAGNQVQWALPDGTVLHVVLDQTRPGNFSSNECLTGVPRQQPLDPAKITAFLGAQAASGTTWVRTGDRLTLAQPFLDGPTVESAMSISSDGELFAFLIPAKDPSAVVVTTVPADLAAKVHAALAGDSAKAFDKVNDSFAKATQAADAAIASGNALHGRPAPNPRGAAAPPASPPPGWRWPAIESDLPPDPNVTWGRLPNGVRYAILPNAEPKGRISLRLLVATGSMYERDDESGIAHFVEHLVFQGTKSHPGNSLSQELERLGLGMGPDNTAFTTYDTTTFHLELPKTDEAMLRRCLQALREYATEAAFDPAAIDRERGVVLSEWATRANSGFFSACANTAFLWPHSRRAERVPIGQASTIRNCTRKQLLAFYRAWYRPERLAVVVVGNVAPDTAAALIREVFGSVKARGRSRDEPPDLVSAAASKPNVLVFSDKSQNGVAYLFEHPAPFPRAADTRARRIKALHAALGFVMFQNRLEKYAAEFPGAFADPHTLVDYSVPGWRTAVLTAAGRFDNWRQMAAALEKEHRRAFAHGFTDEELRIVRANWVNAYDEGVRMAATRPSPWLANALVGCLECGQVFSTPATVRDDLAPALAAATAAECSAAFRRVWGNEPLHVFMTANPAYPIDATGLVAVLNRSRDQDAPDIVRPAAATFAYVDFGPPGALVRDEHLADLDVHLAEFANGVRLNFKPTTFVADGVEIRVRVGTGLLGQPASAPGLALFASSAFTTGGLGRHSRRDLEDLFAGHSLSVRFSVDTDAGVFDGQCARRDLPLTLQLITAYMTDPAFRPEAMDEVRAKLSMMYSRMAESAGCPINMQSPRILAGGDRRFGTPELDAVMALDMTALARWLGPELKHGPVEMSVVGDISWEEARTAVARTLGALPPRQPRPAVAEDRGVRAPEPDPKPYSFLTPPTMRQIALAWAWPVPDLADIHQERRCDLLAAVVADRLHERLREQLGASYAPSAGFASSDGFPAYSYLMAYAEVLPAQAEQAGKLVRAEIAGLRARPLGPDEFARVIQPFLRSRDDQLRSNPFWCIAVLSDAQQRPQRIVAARDRAADSASITPAEIQALANRYLDPNRTFFFVAVPTPPRSG